MQSGKVSVWLRHYQRNKTLSSYVRDIGVLFAALTVHAQCLSGRGDKDVEQISQLLPGKWEDILDWHVSAQV